MRDKKSEKDEFFLKVRAEPWHERAREILEQQVANGGTVHGYRQDGSYVARSSSGVRIVEPGIARSEAILRKP